jgi:uncharacterized membrane protein HdeD (DUF308 family)
LILHNKYKEKGQEMQVFLGVIGIIMILVGGLFFAKAETAINECLAATVFGFGWTLLGIAWLGDVVAARAKRIIELLEQHPRG